MRVLPGARWDPDYRRPRCDGFREQACWEILTTEDLDRLPTPKTKWVGGIPTIEDQQHQPWRLFHKSDVLGPPLAGLVLANIPCH